MLKGRGNWLPQAFDKAAALLQQQGNGYLLVVEGAQVDYGGHANHIGYIAEEVKDLDQVIGKAMQLADADKETLVIITADHETGGLSLLDGDITKGYVSGHFSTNDHTAIPVPVYAYGPQAQLFTGVYENTAIFDKILQALGIRERPVAR
jgi:alkaline phosphatase